MTNEVLHERRGAAFWITINRPERRNAINAAVIDGIVEGYRAAHADASVRVIVLTGAGDKAFCAGADLQPGKASPSTRRARTHPTPTCCAPRRTRPSRPSPASTARAWRAASDCCA